MFDSKESMMVITPRVFQYDERAESVQTSSGGVPQDLTLWRSFGLKIHAFRFDLMFGGRFIAPGVCLCIPATFTRKLLLCMEDARARCARGGALYFADEALRRARKNSTLEFDESVRT